MRDDAGQLLSSLSGQYAACSDCRDLGLTADPNRESYASLARESLPTPVKVLFIAESAPARNKRGRHSYFFLPEDDTKTSDASALFWEMATVLRLAESCGTKSAVAKSSPGEWKSRCLAEFTSRGLWLLDSAKCAVNGLGAKKARDVALARCASLWLKQELATISPEHIVLIKTNVFGELKPLLDSWGFGNRVLNTRAIPHPGSGRQKEFRQLLGAIVQANARLFGV